MLIKKRKWITKMWDNKVKIHARKRSPNTSITTINVNAVNSLKIRVTQPPFFSQRKKQKVIIVPLLLEQVFEIIFCIY